MLSRPADPWPHSHHELIDHYLAQQDEAIASGYYQPFLYPWGAVSQLLVIIYLLIPHQNRPWLKNCRYLVFALLTAFATYTIVYTRARGLVPAMVIGLISSWTIVWTSALLVCNNAQTDFMRIERTQGVFGSDVLREKMKDHADASAETKETNAANSIREDLANGSSGPRERHGEFAWQPYPLAPLIERLDWVLDVFYNFRGMGWNWRTSALPPPPKSIQSQLRRNSSTRVPRHSYKAHSGQLKQYVLRAELLRSNTWTLIKGYLMLDALKTVMMYDPYFWGYVHRPPPSHFPWVLTNSPVLTHTYRLFLSMLGIKYALQSVFCLPPLFFSGILSPSLLGARAEPWMYPETWGPYSVVLDKGLAGWWGNWWHQTFRFAFQEPSRKLIELLGLHKTGAVAKALQLFIAFFLSGFVHAIGSVTCVGDTDPLRGPMAFFLLQAVAMFAEQCLSQAASAAGIGRNLPSWLIKGWKFVYVHVWFYWTAHLICNDFAKGGIWLLEPVPFSLLRGLGLGADEKDGWWNWGGQFVRWHSGDRWWRSGIAI